MNGHSAELLLLLSVTTSETPLPWWEATLQPPEVPLRQMPLVSYKLELGTRPRAPRLVCLELPGGCSAGTCAKEPELCSFLTKSGWRRGFARQARCEVFRIRA